MDQENFMNTIIENDDLLSTYVKYKRQITSIHDDICTHNTKVTIQQNYNQFQLKHFQKDIIDIISQAPDSRKVNWFFDYQGNAGKTWLSTLLVCRYNAIRFENAKSADIKHANNGQPIAVFDLSRSSGEHINYEVIEAIKNGIFFSSKYESKMKVFPTPTSLFSQISALTQQSSVTTDGIFTILMTTNASWTLQHSIHLLPIPHQTGWISRHVLLTMPPIAGSDWRLISELPMPMIIY